MGSGARGKGGHDANGTPGPAAQPPQQASQSDPARPPARQCLDEYYTGDKPTANIPPGANLGAKQYRDIWGEKINRGELLRRLIPPWVRHHLPADEVPAGNGAGLDEERDDDDRAGQGGYGSSSEEYGEWSQPQSQAGSGVAAKRPGEAEAGAGWKRQRQGE